MVPRPGRSFELQLRAYPLKNELSPVQPQLQAQDLESDLALSKLSIWLPPSVGVCHSCRVLCLLFLLGAALFYLASRELTGTSLFRSLQGRDQGLSSPGRPWSGHEGGSRVESRDSRLFLVIPTSGVERWRYRSGGKCL